MERTHKTPGGLYVLRNDETENPFLKAYDSPLHPMILPTDITYPHAPKDTIHPAHENAFLEAIDTFEEVDGYHYLPPSRVAEHKDSLLRPRRKDRRDIKLIGQHLMGKGHFGR